MKADPADVPGPDRRRLISTAAVWTRHNGGKWKHASSTLIGIPGNKIITLLSYGVQLSSRSPRMPCERGTRATCLDLTIFLSKKKKTNLIYSWYIFVSREFFIPDLNSSRPIQKRESRSGFCIGYRGINRITISTRYNPKYKIRGEKWR